MSCAKQMRAELAARIRVGEELEWVATQLRSGKVEAHIVGPGAMEKWLLMRCYAQGFADGTWQTLCGKTRYQLLSLATFDVWGELRGLERTDAFNLAIDVCPDCWEREQNGAC